MKAILDKYLDTEIGINATQLNRIDAMKLVEVMDNHFSVQDPKTDDLLTIPFSNIVKVLRNPSGIKVGGMFEQKKEFPIIVKVGHVVQYIVT